AGSPPISTVLLPSATTPPTCGFTPSTSGQACVSAVARHAGIPPISTVGQPGPGPSGVPWPVRSPTRAAGCPIASALLVERDHRAVERELGPGFHIERAGGGNLDRSGVDRQLASRVDFDVAACAVDLEMISVLVLERNAL